MTVLDNFENLRAKYEIAAKYAHAAGGHFTSKWGDLSKEERLRWLLITEAAVRSYPGPMAIDVYVKFPKVPGAVPILREFACDVTPDSIETASKQFREFLLELAGQHRPEFDSPGMRSTR